MFKPITFLCFLVVVLFPCGVLAQVNVEPRREQILNGLQVLIARRITDPKLTLSLRVHSGAAFDLAGKGGTMALMSDLLFPDPATREYVADELGGKLDVVTSYDAVDVVLSGRPTEFERLVELLRTALVSTPFTPDEFERARAARIKITEGILQVPATIADQAIQARLFGSFPYGHPVSGTPESLAKVDRGDILQARERFLNPNNATLVVSGNIENDRVLRALRQLLGGWRKSESVVPQTFRQPTAPDDRVLVVNAPGSGSAELRLAVRGLSRSDKDFYAAEVLAEVLKNHWGGSLPELTRAPTFVRNDALALPGSFVLGTAVPTDKVQRALAEARRAIDALLKNSSTSSEFAPAKSAVTAAFRMKTEKDGELANLWLQISTYGLPSLKEQSARLEAVTPEDVRRVAVRLFDKSPMAIVAVGNSEELASAFGGADRVEFFRPATTTNAATSGTQKKP